MGRAKIVENIGEGLYKVQMLWNLAPLVAELADIAKQDAEYAEVLGAAMRTIQEMEDAKADSQEAVNAVIQQWRDGLIGPNLDPPDFPEPPPEAPPGTSASAQMATDLFEAINDARSAEGAGALQRITELNSAASTILDYLNNTRATADTRYMPEHRAVVAGYSYDIAVGADSLLSFGHTSNDLAISYWLRGSRSSTALLSENYTECGTAARYSSGSAYTYSRCAILSAPGPVNTITWPEDDPARDAAEETEALLDTVQPPTPESGQPLNVVEAVTAYRKAAEAYRMAEMAVERIKTEAEARGKRRKLLEDLRVRCEIVIWAWACVYVADLEPGAIMSTAEIPGWWQDDPLDRITTMGVRADPDLEEPNYDVPYTERSINIIGPVDSNTGQLRPSETLSDAIVFVNAALEPGWLRWQPTWRYGTVTEIVGGLHTLSLATPKVSRSLSPGEPLMLLDSSDIGDLPMFDVPIEPRNNASMCDVVVGDEVLVEFAGQSIDAPRIIGWRREPRPCFAEQIWWGQIR